MKAFIVLLYLAGVYRGSRLNMDDLWDTNGDGIETFRLTMSLRRFDFLSGALGSTTERQEGRGENWTDLQPYEMFPKTLSPTAKNAILSVKMSH
ncbi:hypothetical protein AVEN_94804-1 [Araneus ventricosus]|uniref:PiggyBac transposable element-derived protein domain-containing protein n=1 Tax=Araneus ventricosus TaxID=182803 RepID=A0A4Y2CM83_ARAVE|nr:hypothetical protein AVEN_94804-1 [Araneus ventricosus]